MRGGLGNCLGAAALLVALTATGCGRRTPIDLVEQFVGAKVYWTPAHVDIGTESARAYLGDGWGADETRENGTTVAWGVGPVSEFRFFVQEPRKLHFRIRGAPVRFDGAPRQEVAIAVNGQAVGEYWINGGKKGKRFRVPASALRSGSNEMTLTYAYTRSLADLGVGDDERQLGVAWDWIRIEGARDEEVGIEGSVLSIPVGTRIDYFVDLAAPTRFEADASGSARGSELRVEVEFENGDSLSELFVLDPVDAKRRIHLDVGGPGLARVSLTAVGSPRTELKLDHPRLLVEGRREVAASSPRRNNPRETGDPPNVLVFLVDTLRADHLGCYGYERNTSPHLDAFAGEATVFENTLAQAPWTRPSVASVFTGLTPQAHGVERTHSRLPEEALTLGEVFDAAGYDTVGFVTNPNAAPSLGFSQGFDEYRLTRDSDSDSKADRVVGLFEDWLDARATPERPFFAYLHTGEPHGPYAPRADLRERFGSVRSLAVGSKDDLQRLSHGDGEATEDYIAELFRLYDAEILWNDMSFGRLLEVLRRHHQYENTLLVFLSDHGEAFREHGTWQHGKALYREVIGVPLVIRFPEIGHGRRVSAPAQHVDLLPTLLSAAGLTVPSALPGRDLVRLVVGEAAVADLEVLSSVVRQRGRRTAAVTTREWRLIQSWSASSGLESELYRWRQDPTEKADIASAHPLVVGYLQARLAMLGAADVGRLEAEEIELDPEIEERLRALGYLN